VDLAEIQGHEVQDIGRDYHEKYHKQKDMGSEASYKHYIV